MLTANVNDSHTWVG